jgi:hypothetical protein
LQLGVAASGWCAECVGCVECVECGQCVGCIERIGFVERIECIGVTIAPATPPRTTRVDG